MPPAHSSVHALQLCFKKKIRKLVGGTQSDPRMWEANSQQIERSARARVELVFPFSFIK
jgi:hypothetical protein